MPAVTRIGDADVTHCSGMTRAAGSSNVFANGIGVSRLDGAAIEANYNDDVMKWPKTISPFDVVILPSINKNNNENLQKDEKI